jgi:hypothetical protein
MDPSITRQINDRYSAFASTTQVNTPSEVEFAAGTEQNVTASTSSPNNPAPPSVRQSPLQLRGLPSRPPFVFRFRRSQ